MRESRTHLRLRSLITSLALLVVSTGCSPEQIAEPAVMSHLGPLINADTFPIIEPTGLHTVCGSCTFEVDSVTTLGSDADTVYYNAPASVVQAADQQFYIAPVSVRGTVARYDHQGKFTGLLGRWGRGPGELNLPSGLVSLDSSIAIFDFSRVLIISLDGSDTTMLRVDPPVGEFDNIVLPGGTFVAAAMQRPTTRNLIVISPEGESYTFGDSTFYHGAAESEQRRAAVVRRFLTPLDSTRFLAMPGLFRPEVERWNTSGLLEARFSLPAPWFPEYGMAELTEYQKHGRRISAIARARNLHVDGGGRLWTLTYVKDSFWNDQPEVQTLATEDGGPPVRQYWGYDRRKVEDAVLAVYMLADTGATLLASTRFDIPFSRFLSDTTIVEEVDIERDLKRFNVFKFRLAPDSGTLD